MPAFETRVRYSKITISPISTEDMATIAGLVLDHIKARIQSVRDDEDNPARPLNLKYAAQKVKGRHVKLGGTTVYRGKNVRDWTLRGRLMQSLKLKSVSQEAATIGPVSQEAATIIAARNPLDHMWGMSPSDNEVLHEAVYSTIVETGRLRIEKTGVERIVA